VILPDPAAALRAIDHLDQVVVLLARDLTWAAHLGAPWPRCSRAPGSRLRWPSLFGEPRPQKRDVARARLGRPMSRQPDTRRGCNLLPGWIPAGTSRRRTPQPIRCRSRDRHGGTAAPYPASAGRGRAPPGPAGPAWSRGLRRAPGHVGHLAVAPFHQNALTAPQPAAPSPSACSLAPPSSCAFNSAPSSTA